MKIIVSALHSNLINGDLPENPTCSTAETVGCFLVEKQVFSFFLSLPGNYTQALEDFQECLKLQVTHLDSDSRLLAETHYQLGLTYSLNLQYSQAIEELKSSISVIKSRLGKQGWLDGWKNMFAR